MFNNIKTLYFKIDWAVVVVASWFIPLFVFNFWNISYIHSELFWVIPIVALFPRFWNVTHPGSRRRKALAITTSLLLISGSVLDLIFGKYILTFGPTSSYVYVLFGVPIEEFIFYLLGPIAMIMVYFWADEYLLRSTRPIRDMSISNTTNAIVSYAPKVMIQVVLMIIAGVVVKSIVSSSHFPMYYTFLVLMAYGPLILLWNSVSKWVNWPALALTVLYTLISSIIWEAMLGVPIGWWGYQSDAMLGIWIKAIQTSLHVALPIEAVSVWIVAPFACVFFFETIRALQYHSAKTLKGKLFGPSKL
jgi:hypothetical protein